MTETQERFLRTVLTRVPLASVVELHLFPPIRRGTMETGVAVIATELPADVVVLVAPDDHDSPSAHHDAPEEGDAAMESTAAADAADTADADGIVSESVIVEAPPAHAPRLRILTAAYRHTIKGIDRGKWTVDVQEEADAPLEAVEAVLRGVRHRSAEAADPELVVHDTLAALIAPVRVAPAA